MNRNLRNAQMSTEPITVSDASIAATKIESLGNGIDTLSVPTVNPAWIALSGVIAGAFLTLLGSYFVTYQLIEKPKIDLEIRKTAIEALKQAQALTPSVDHSCEPVIIDNWTWKLTCTTRNTGKFTAEISISEVVVALISEPGEPEYKEGQGFSVAFPNKKRSFWAPPDSTGQLRAYITFDKQRYPEGVGRSDMEARVRFAHKTVDAAQDFMFAQFPTTENLIRSTANGGTSLLIRLPVQVAVAK
jgi:hypothetical protein